MISRGQERPMSEQDDFSQLDDPAFLAERARVREELERMPDHDQSPELVARFARLDAEFVRRARVVWTTWTGQ
jgi:hypothetical protein